MNSALQEDLNRTRPVGVTTRLNKAFNVLSYDEMTRMPLPEWQVEGVIQQQSAVLMYGASNSFKSFLALDMGLSVATGNSWHDLRVEQGRVLVVATEGANGVGRLRVPAWYEHHNVLPWLRDDLFLLAREVCLDVEQEVSKLIQSIEQIGEVKLLILDIFGGCMSGSEIEDRTARAWVHGVQRIIRETGATVMAVAHTGWSNQERARMHTHFWGSFDTRLRVVGEKDKMTTVMSVERHKDADSAGEWGFRLEKSSTSLVPVLDAGVKSSQRSILSGQPRAALNVLDDAIKERGQVLSGESWPACKVVSLEQWKECCRRLPLSESDDLESQRKAFNRARAYLQKNDYISILDGHVWRRLDDQTNGTD